MSLSTVSTRPVFVGRARELAVLRAHLDDALAGCGRLVLLAGEPGIGKTRLAQEVATQAQERGARVYTGRCYAGEGAPPFWPWVQIVRAYLQACDLDTVRADLGSGAAAIAQVIPDVRERLPQLPAAPPLESAQARFHVFDRFTTSLTTVAHAQPLVLVLDDLHWADASSLLFLQFLVRELGTAPLLVLGAYRDSALDLRPPSVRRWGSSRRRREARPLPCTGSRSPRSRGSSTTPLASPRMRRC
jgi:predicted ATPase